MAKPIKRYFYLIERKTLNEADVSGVLDMLRYDHATVEPNPPAGYYMLAASGPPEIRRWESFGIKIAFVPARASEWDDDARVWASQQIELLPTVPTP